MPERFFHSVRLDKEACVGCTNCIKRCPTRAIRVQDGKAKIIIEKCIDCGECIRVCQHHAKKAVFDSLELLNDFAYTIALPAPALYGQFHNLEDVDVVLEGLIRLGFDDVFEVASAAEVISEMTRAEMAKLPKPVISSACPAVTRLIRVRFPGLIDHLLPLNAPVEVAAAIARARAAEKTGLPSERIGVIFITPCPAKVTAIRMPLGLSKSALNGAVAISDIYPVLVREMNQLRGQSVPQRTRSGRIGVGWASSGGEAAATLNEHYLAADGIENVMDVLEDLEDEKLTDLEFIELNACRGGCVGGVLTVENPYIASTRLKWLRRYLPVSMTRFQPESLPARWDTPLTYAPVYTLDPDFGVAMTKLQQIDALTHKLPGLDCGACGAPTCRDLAEDVVQGFAKPSACVYLLKEYLDTLTNQLADDAVPKSAITPPGEFALFEEPDKAEANS